jgi:hypothetical protein
LRAVHQRLRDMLLLPAWAYTSVLRRRSEDALLSWWLERYTLYLRFVLLHLVLSFLLLIALTLLPPNAGNRDTGWPDSFLFVLLAPLAIFPVTLAYFSGLMAHYLLRRVVGKSKKTGPLLLRLGIGFSLFVLYFPPIAQAVHWLYDFSARMRW